MGAACGLEHCGFVSSLEELYVMPGWRQKGVGTALLTAVFDRATSAGMTAIELEVGVGIVESCLSIRDSGSDDWSVLGG